jgi:hypothetical protein
VLLCRGVGIPRGTQLSDECVGCIGGGDFAVGACGFVCPVLMFGSSPGVPVSNRIGEAFLFSLCRTGLNMWGHDNAGEEILGSSSAPPYPPVL